VRATRRVGRQFAGGLPTSAIAIREKQKQEQEQEQDDAG
jgi:hypothetical protein